MTAATTLAIRAAASADRPAVVRLFAAAYADSDVARWLVSDPDARRPHSLGRTAVDLDQALEQGTIDVASAEREEVIGAALWLPHPSPAGRQPEALPPGPAGDTHPADMRAVLHRRHQLDELLQPRHPARAHHHLTHLVVHPNRRGHGVGSQLLLYHHAYLHAVGIGAYLDADHPNACDLFHRPGYTTIGPPLLLPGTGIPLWPMSRPSEPPTIGPVPAGRPPWR